MADERSSQIVSIQYLRGFAALLVIFQHAHEQIPAFQAYMDTSFGAGGVDLFFIISGVVMIQSTSRHRPTRRDFMLRRVERIVPLYWTMTALVAVLLIAAHGLVESSVFTVDSFVKSLLFIPSLNPGKDELSPMLKLGWTLNFEMFFYLVFAVFLPLGAVKRIGCITATFLLFYVWGRVLGSQWRPVQFWSDPIVLEFVLGAVIGLVDLRGWLCPLPRWAVYSALAIGVVSFVALSDVPVARLWVRGLPAFIVVGSLIAMERNGLFRFGRGIMRTIGDASYSIYLSHLYGIIAARLLWNRAHLPHGPLSAASFVVFCYAVGLALGLAVYFFFEKPIIDYFSRTRRLQRTPSLVKPA